MPRRAGASDRSLQEVPGWNVVTPHPTVIGTGSTAVPLPTVSPCDLSGPIPAGQTRNGPRLSGTGAASRSRRHTRPRPRVTRAPHTQPVSRCRRPGPAVPVVLVFLAGPAFLAERVFPRERVAGQAFLRGQLFLRGQVFLRGRVFRAPTESARPAASAAGGG